MNMKLKLLWGFVAIGIICASPAYALVICDWEGTPDNAKHWPTGVLVDDSSVMPSIYEYASIGATSGSQSLKMTTGTGDTYDVYQYLALALTYDQREAFLDNNRVFIDFTVGPGTGGGRMQIYNVILNAEGMGWNSVIDDVTSSEGQLYFDMWNGSPTRTMTLSFDYDASGLSVPGYVEIIFEVQDGGSAEPYFYWDNARISYVPDVVGSYEQEILADSPELYLRLEEDAQIGGAGYAPLTDSSANGYWAGCRADTEFRAGEGIGGNCRYLPATGNNNAIAAAKENPSYSSASGDEYAFVDGDITFEFWFNSDANDMNYGVFFQQIKDDQTKAPGVGIDTGNDTLRVLNGAGDWWYPYDGPDPVAVPLDGQWHHVVVTYDESLPTDDPNYLMGIQLYLDGQLRSSTVVGDETTPARLGPEMTHVCIGGLNDYGYTYNNYKGLIDEFAIYAGILPADRVEAHYGAGLCVLSKGDVTGDCKVNLEDFAQVAAGWLLCNDPALFGIDSDCEPSW